jgi:hypothetical protein
MIALNSDCLLFQLSNGESVPCSAEMITVEIAGGVEGLLDPDMLKHAAASVFHYFKDELCRESVTVGEFSVALEKVLRGLGYAIRSGPEPLAGHQIAETNLDLLANESGDSLELLFFPRLRDELRHRLRQSPRMLRFRGLRGCVKQLAGARRWSARCEQLQDQIIEYLRQCLTAEPEQNECPMVVE